MFEVVMFIFQIFVFELFVSEKGKFIDWVVNNLNVKMYLFLLLFEFDIVVVIDYVMDVEEQVVIVSLM